MKRMLVNATQQEELRVALVDGQKLYDLIDRDYLPANRRKPTSTKRGSRASSRRSKPASSITAPQRHGFLPLKEISKEYFRQQPQGGRMNIRELLTEGQELVVQVEKEERGTKGAALTTFISLAGRFLVLMPNNPRAGGVSRRIEGEDRDQMREVMSQLHDPRRHGRDHAHRRRRPHGRGTAVGPRQPQDAVGRRSTRPSRTGRAPFLVYQESDAVTRSCATTSATTSAKCWSTTRPPSRRRRSTCSASCRRTRSAS